MWKVKMQMYIFDKDMWKFVDGFEIISITLELQVDWDKRDNKAKANIFLMFTCYKFFNFLIFFCSMFVFKHTTNTTSHFFWCIKSLTKWSCELFKCKKNILERWHFYKRRRFWSFIDLPQPIIIISNEELVESNSNPFDYGIECENEKEIMDWGMPLLQCSTRDR